MGKATASILVAVIALVGVGGHSLEASTTADVASPPKTITLAISRDSPPFYFVDNRGRARGWVVDVWRLWSRRTGIKVHFLPLAFGDTLRAVKDGRADAHGGLFYSRQRSVFLDYLGPVCPVMTHFFFHRNIYGLRGLKDLRPYRVGVIKGDYALEVLRQRQPGLDLAIFPDNRALFRAVKQGRIRVFVKDTAIALYFLKELGLLHSFRYHPSRPLYQKWFYAAVKKGNAALARVIRAGMKLVTPEERAAIKRRWTGVAAVKPGKVLTIGLPRDRAPLSMLSPDGRAAGLLVDLWRLWSRKTGQRIEFRFGRGQDLAALVRRGQVDVIGGLDRDRLPGAGLALSRPVLAVTVSQFYRLADVPLRLAEMDRGPVGVISGSGDGSRIKKRWPRLSLVRFKGIEALVSALAQGRIRAVVGNGAVLGTAVDRLGLSGAIVRRPERLLVRPLVAAVSRSRPGLLRSINRGLGRVSRLDRSTLEKRWIRDAGLRQYTPTPGRVQLTPAEKAWLQAHPVIRVGVDPAWPPFDFVDRRGRHRGMAADYLALLGRRLGIVFKVATGAAGKPLTWNQVMKQARQRKLDVVACLAETPDRRKYLTFTRPYIRFPWVVVTRKDHPTVGGIEAFHGHRVAVVKGYAIAETLGRSQPGLKLVRVASPLVGLEAVAMGRAEAYAGSLAVVAYLIRRHNLTNLKVAAPAGGRGDRLRLGVRPDWHPLVHILDKGLASISSAERAEIHRHWFSLRFERGVDWGLVWRIALLVGLVAVMILIVIFIWNRRLAREAAIRRKAEERFQSIAANVPGAIFRGHIKPDGTRAFTYVSNRLTEFFGLTPEQLLDDPDNFLVLREDRRRFFETMDEAVVTGRDWEFEGRVQTPSGEKKWFRITARTERTDDEGTLFNGLLLDVTERKKAEEERRESEKRLAQIIDFLPDPTWVIDARHRVVAWNRAMEKMTGIKAEHVIGKGDYEYALPFYGERRPVLIDLVLDWDESYKDKYLSVKKVGQVLVSESYHPGLGPNGTYLSGTAAVLYDAQDHVVGAIESLRDTSERKRSEEELRESEKRLAQIIGFLPDPTWVIDTEHRVVAWNRAVENMTGIKAEDMVGRGDYEYGLAFYGERRPMLIDLVLDWDENYVEKYVSIKRSGGRLLSESYHPRLGVGGTYLEGTATALYDAQNNVVGAIETVRNATSRIEAEKALTDSEARHRALLERLPVPTVVYDMSGLVVLVNPAFEQTFGWSGDEIRGQRIDFVPEGEMEATREKLAAYTQGEPMEGFLTRRRTKDGRILDVQLSAAPFYDQRGRQTGNVVTISDITEQKRAAEALRKSEENLRALVQSSVDPIITMDTGRNVTDCNQAYMDLFGYTREEIIGHSVDNIHLDEEHFVDFGRAVYPRVRDTGGWRGEWPYRAKDGRQIPMETAISAIRLPDGSIEGFVAILRDITERKRAEKELKQNLEDLERFSSLTVGREEKMIQLKEEINRLSDRLGEGRKYKIVT